MAEVLMDETPTSAEGMLLGIDAGGSATRWALFGPEGQVVRQGRLEAMSGHLFTAGDEGEMRAWLLRLAALVQASLDQVGQRLDNHHQGRVGAVVAGVTGLQLQAIALIVTAIAETFALSTDRVRLSDDMALAYAAHFAPGEGVLVYAGTGSMAYHRSASGEVIRAGGHGFLLGDEGGAFWQGQQGLKEVLSAHDTGRVPAGPLARELEAVIGSLDWPQVRAWAYQGGRAALATLAPAVERAALEGDVAAREVLKRAGKALAGLADTVLAQLPKPLPLVLAGGAANDLVQAAFVAELLRRRPEAVLLAPTVPVLGAVRLSPFGFPAPAAPTPPTSPGGFQNMIRPHPVSALDLADTAPHVTGHLATQHHATEHLATEQPSRNHPDLDLSSTAELIAALTDDQFVALRAVRAAAPALERATEEAVLRLRQGGRLVYLGAGTSGRLGVLDGVELLPTFSWPPERLVTLIAGGEGAMFRAAEGAEDDRAAGARDLAAAGLAATDVLIAVAASGTTPYVLGGVEYARRLGALSIGISNNPGSPLLLLADLPIALDTGPEVISGSTRLKAGTAQKITLNTLSSAIMVRLGKVYGNLMVDVQATNLKLRRRALHLTVLATGASPEEAEQALAQAQDHVKTAIVMLRLQLDAPRARTALDRVGGSVRAALDAGTSDVATSDTATSDPAGR